MEWSSIFKETVVNIFWLGKCSAVVNRLNRTQSKFLPKVDLIGSIGAALFILECDLFPLFPLQLFLFCVMNLLKISGPLDNFELLCEGWQPFVKKLQLQFLRAPPWLELIRLLFLFEQLLLR